ncbi:hypothetical protein LguiA_029767 [Lonicera macranthoides]
MMPPEVIRAKKPTSWTAYAEDSSGDGEAREEEQDVAGDDEGQEADELEY